MENIIETLMSTVAGIITAYIAIVPKLKKIKEDDIKREQKQSDDMEYIKIEMTEVKKRLDTHNHYAEKIGDIKTDIKLIKKDIKANKVEMQTLRKEFSNVTCKRK